MAMKLKDHLDNLGVECNFWYTPNTKFYSPSLKLLEFSPRTLDHALSNDLKALAYQYFLHRKLINLLNKILQFLLYPKSNQNLKIQPKYNALSIMYYGAKKWRQ
jgi:hypothetical protein